LQHHQIWATPSNDVKAAAEARRQEAISDAYRAFNVKHAETARKHREAYMAAKADWDAIRSTPEADGYEEAKQAFLAANKPADHTESRAEMDGALRTADEAYQDELGRLAARYGITVR